MQFDLQLIANGAQRLEVDGRFFKYKSGSGLIRVTTSKGEVVDLMPGQGVWNTQFSSLTVTDRTGAANTGILMAGNIDFRDDRISGTVDVVDGGRTRTLGGTVFSGTRGPGATAGNVNNVQLWNPVSSGKRVIVAQLTAGASAQDVLGVGIYNAMLTGAPAYGTNKRSDGAPSTAEIRWQINPIPLVSPMNNLPVPAWTALINRYTEPVVIMPGNGLCVANNFVNVGLYVTFEFYEEMI